MRNHFFFSSPKRFYPNEDSTKKSTFLSHFHVNEKKTWKKKRQVSSILQKACTRWRLKMFLLLNTRIGLGDTQSNSRQSAIQWRWNNSKVTFVDWLTGKCCCLIFQERRSIRNAIHFASRQKSEWIWIQAFRWHFVIWQI